ncbi:MAG: aspartate aminotransferase family protein [Gammaproteobacteria bacterium]|nr:aspartate aminotransferase family protein [Gammaproteobacteria bacterium]
MLLCVWFVIFASKIMTAVFYRAPAHRYPMAASAAGMTIKDRSGKAYLDMSGGAAVSCLGHSHPDVVAAIREQVGTLAFAHTAFFSNQPQEDLAARIAARFTEPSARVYFLSGGSEANETALKVAWQYWVARGKPAKKIIIGRDHSYHGNTFGVLSASGNDSRRRASAAPLVDWPRIPPCYEYRERQANESVEEYSARSAGYLDDAIRKAGAENVAAFICEPVVGSSLGVVAATPGYLAQVREICDRHNVLLIADEIMCGSGRSGSYFAHQHDSVVPDMVTLAKGIGGGYQPLAAVVIRQNIAGELHRAGFAHGHTYVGHATACAAGVAVQQVLDRDKLLVRTREMGGIFLSMLRDAFGHHAHVGDIRGRGLFFGIELVRDRETRRGFDNGRQLPDQLRLSAMDEGLICYPGSIEVEGRTVPHIMMAPPMIVEERHFSECIGKLKSVFDRILPRN